jgi:pseudouridine synthase
MQKHYRVLVQGCPTETTLAKLRQGVTITEDDGHSHLTAPAQVHPLGRTGPNCWLTIIIHEGRKRQVRRMLSAVGHPVLQLIRTAIGPFTLGNLPPGAWRHLTNEEVKMLSNQP